MARGASRLLKAAALVGAVLASAVSMSQAEAASRICRQLEAQLASASRGGGGGSAKVRKYDGAISRQQDQLSKARSRASNAGCGFTLFRSNVSECAAINANIGRMNDNLDALQKKRTQLAGGGGSSKRDRARIVASLEANGCRDMATASNQPIERKPGGMSLLEQIFGGGSSVRQLDSLDDPIEDVTNGGRVRRVINQPGVYALRGSGDYHTMCVRTCDGYYFPMSNAASFGEFERDQKNCESSCPGTEMQVFYKQGMDDDSAGMTSSVTGRPYSELPTAYLYKKADFSRPLACGCNATAAARGFEVIAGNPPAVPQSTPIDEGSFYTPMPTAKPDPAADPETLANAEGGLSAEAIRQLAVKETGATATAEPVKDRKVRVVGPAFLPDQAEAIDLQALARKPSR